MTAGDPYGWRTPMGPPPPETPRPDSETVELLSITVLRPKRYATDDNADHFDNVSGWTVDDRDRLFIRREDVEVKVYAPRCWYGVECTVTFKDGHGVSPAGSVSPAVDVGMGVQVTAMGGRTL